MKRAVAALPDAQKGLRQPGLGEGGEEGEHDIECAIYETMNVDIKISSRFVYGVSHLMPISVKWDVSFNPMKRSTTHIILKKLCHNFPVLLQLCLHTGHQPSLLHLAQLLVLPPHTLPERGVRQVHLLLRRGERGALHLE